MKANEINSLGRFSIIDKLKAIGILLIMFGHAPGLGKANFFIYSFHVPLFFIISGFLVSEKHLAITLNEKCTKLFKTLLIPYVFFFLFSWAYWCVTRKYANLPEYLKEKSCFDALIGVFIGTGRSLFVNPALWFFVALFWVSLIYHITAKIVKNKSFVFLFFLVILFCLVDFFYDYLNFENCILLQVFAGLAFYSFGVFMRSKKEVYDFIGSRFSFFCIPLFFLLSNINGVVDINYHKFGSSSVLYFFVAILGFFGLAWVLNYVRINRFMMFFSLNSLLIFATHMVIFKVVTACFQILTGSPSPYALGYWWFGLLYVFITSLIFYLAAPFFNKNFPFLVGKSV